MEKSNSKIIYPVTLVVKLGAFSICVINPGSEIRAISVNSGVALFLCLLIYPNFSKVKNVDNYLFAGKLTKHNQAAANRSSCD